MSLVDKFPEIQAVLDGGSDGCIVCADCLDVLPLMPDGCVDAVVTDPPYGVKFASWDDSRPPDKWFEEIQRIAPSCAVHAAQGEIWSWPKPDWVMAWFMPGSINRTKSGKFRHWEPVLIYGKERASCDSKVFPPIGAKRNGHPCPKPDAIENWLVGAFAKEGELICDPMMGSGTTCVAAKKLGRRYIGIDISEEYCDIARDRLLQLDGKRLAKVVKHQGLFDV